VTGHLAIWLAVSALFAGILITAAVIDVRTMTIPNWLPIAMFAGFLAFAPFLSNGTVFDGAFVEHLAAGAVATAVVLGFYVARVMGGGDVKLIAATAFWFDFGELAVFAIATGLAGGVLGLLTLARLRAQGVSEGAGKRPVPYAIAIAAGGIVAWFL
jgi:prepilin peptidase CpaA